MYRYACILLLSASAVSFAGCTSLPFAYQPEVQQGNIITEEMLDDLRPGMSRREARQVLGSPAIEDMFRTNRWDYVHSSSPGGGGATERLTLIFDDNDQLIELRGDRVPENWGS